jgi:hypothetical protein
MSHITVVPKIIINFPQDGKIRSRKVVKRSNARNSGKYPSWKMQRMMQWESVHEGNAMRILDANPSVISFNEQPCEIIYILNGEKRRHYPDFLVIEADQKEFWEVKTAKDANQPEVAERTAFLTTALPYYGYSYHMVIAESLASQPQLSNIKRLNKLGRQALTVVQQETLRRLFKQQPVMDWSVFENQSPVTLRQISRLILEGKLNIDLHQPIHAATQIRSNFNTQD